jgi:hypothetical protein
MITKRVTALAVVLALLAGTTAPVSAEIFQATIHGGISDAVDEENPDWNVGLTVGATGFFVLNPHVLAGLRFAYNRWSADESEWNAKVDNVTDADASGAANVFEIVPSVRIGTAFEYRPVNFFAQFGAGVNIFFSDVDVSGSRAGSEFETSFSSDTRGRFTAQIGAGIALGSVDVFTLEILPLYHVAVPLDDAVDYYSVEIGLTRRW